MKTQKITSIRILSNKLDERSVYMFEIGLNLMKRIELWEKRKEIEIGSGNGIRFIKKLQKR